MDNDTLLQYARQAMQNSYAPYSNFPVGAALLAKSGKVYTGCNVECVCGTSCCAERTVLYKAVSEGEREFATIAVAAAHMEEIYPCGICRQMLAEFSGDMRVIVSKEKEHSLGELLPHVFTK